MVKELEIKADGEVTPIIKKNLRVKKKSKKQIKDLFKENFNIDDIKSDLQNNRQTFLLKKYRDFKEDNDILGNLNDLMDYRQSPPNKLGNQVLVETLEALVNKEIIEEREYNKAMNVLKKALNLENSINKEWSNYQSFLDDGIPINLEAKEEEEKFAKASSFKEAMDGKAEEREAKFIKDMEIKTKKDLGENSKEFLKFVEDQKIKEGGEKYIKKQEKKGRRGVEKDPIVSSFKIKKLDERQKKEVKDFKEEDRDEKRDGDKEDVKEIIKNQAKELKDFKDEKERIEKEGNPNLDPNSSSSSSSKNPKMMGGSGSGLDQETHTMPDGTVMTGKKHNKDSMKLEDTNKDPFVLPTSIDNIPPSRLSSSFKDIEVLNDDIKYFLENFKTILKTEKKTYEKIDKNKIEQVRKLHNKITGKLSPNLEREKSKGKKVGVVIDAQKYIQSEMKRLLENNTFSRMTPSDVVINVGEGNSNDKDKDVRDYGDFEVKKNAEGGLASRREGIYRYQPTVNDDEVGEDKVDYSKRRKPKRLANIPLEEINQATTGTRMNNSNPFTRKKRTIKLKYLY